MKRIFYILLCIVAAVAACQPIDPVEGLAPTENVLTVTSNVPVYSMEGGEDILTLTLHSTQKQWTLWQSSGTDWCKPGVFSGKTSSSIHIRVAPNTGVPREAILVFSSPLCKNDTLRINQEGLMVEPLPSDDLKYGINYDVENNAVTLVLFDKDLHNQTHDYCYLISEFSDWEPSADYAMKRDDVRDCWWYTLTDLNPDKEYMFQYYVGNVGKKPIRVSDPYTEIVYMDGDVKISDTTYPDMPLYPEKTSGMVSAFKINRDQFDWSGDDFMIEDKNDLVIYELLLRDFSSDRNLQTAIDSIAYFKRLGINAIELMPVQEFDSSLGWGYDPTSYFALDKDYGTREKYKEFIKICHANDIAVIFDVVYNHLTGASTLAKLYYGHNRTAALNPWFNQEAPHGFSVFHDLRHDNRFVVDHIKENLKYLLEEYHIDGFRFDLTKGFTQRSGTEGSYDDQRIAILKGYYDTIYETNPHAVMICEHLVGGQEEIELGGYRRDEGLDHGIKLWRNMNEPYCQTAMGYQEGSDLTGTHARDGMAFGSLVSYMESHDEERMGYKQTAYAPDDVKNNLAARMKRLELNAAFFLLVPGPKMIWQFGELGYDFSIRQNDKGKFHESDEDGYRTSPKPIKWEYYEDPARKSLYDAYAKLLKFRFSGGDNWRFFDDGAPFDYYVDASCWPGKYIFCQEPGNGARRFAVVGNFGTTAATVNVDAPVDGPWYNYYNTSEVYNGSTFDINLGPSDYRILVNWK